MSIPSRGKGKLTLEEEKFLSKDLVEKLLSQLEREFVNGPYLEPGYFANKTNLNFERKLVVELIGKRTAKEPVGNLEPLPKTATIKKKAVTIKEEEVERKKIVKVEAEVSDKKETWRPKSEKVKNIKKELKMTWKGKRRSALLRDLAVLHLEEDLHEDALAYATKAYEENPTEENFELLRKLESNGKEPLDKFRFNNEVRDLDLSFLLKTEFDTNVIQDAVDSSVQRDSDELLIQAAFLVDKKWGWKLGELEQYTSYDFSQSFYAEEQDLDLMTHRLGHDMSALYEQSRLDFGLGYNYFVRRGKSLLDGADFNLAYSYFSKTYDQIYKASIVWLDKNYSDHFYDSTIRNGTQLQYDLNWSGSFFDGHRFGFELGLLEDDLKDPTLSYSSTSTGIKWEIDVFHLLTDKVIPSFKYHRRKYDDAQPGRNIRKDSRFTYGIQSIKKVGKYQNLFANVMYTDNQSSRRVSRYKRTQVALGYQIDF